MAGTPGSSPAVLSPPRLGPPPSARRIAATPAVRFASVTAQLALVLALAHVFRIEAGVGLPRLLPLIFLGFLMHAAAPAAWRLPFFVVLSFAGLGVLLGLPHAPAVVALGLALLAVAHLPIAFPARVALLVLAGAGLALVRAEVVRTPWDAVPGVVLPLVGSMFMFRLALYLYELHHDRTPVPLAERLAYFFMLPNVFFLLFPVVDFRTFRRTRYDGEAFAIYQKGVLWILRGLTHLLLYRIVDHHLLLSPGEVQDLAGVARQVVATYLLYLRISGQFHIAVGILCLFGFNLPETHHLYYLASSFTDFWRRINIYWKDFMTKLVYYPSFVRLRGAGLATGVALATLVVFAATWLLHAYQWFWLRGTFPLTLPDALFWSVLGVLVVLTALYELRHGRARRLGIPAWSARRALRLSLRTLAMFVLLALLWSLWSSASVAEWLDLLGAARRGGAPQVIGLALALSLLVAGGVALQYGAHRGWIPALAGSRPDPRRAAAYTVVVGGALAAVALAGPAATWAGPAAPVIEAMRDPGISARDRDRLQRGYYEGLLSPSRYASTLAALDLDERDWRPIWETDAVRERDDLLLFELVPLHSGVLKGAPMRTNEWGMSDDPYSRSKPAGTIRVALLGASYEMAAGVPRERGFESVAERRLNAQPLLPGGRYEILNFAVGGYSTVQHALLAKGRALDFEPDLILVAVHAAEPRRAVETLVRAVLRDVPIEDAELREILRRAGIHGHTREGDLRPRLEAVADELLRWSFARLAAVSAEQRIPVVLLYVPQTVTGGNVRATPARLAALAGDAGLPLLSLEGAYAGRDVTTLQIAPWDDHPNAEGHRLLAERLVEVLGGFLRADQGRAHSSTTGALPASPAPVHTDSSPTESSR